MTGISTLGQSLAQVDRIKTSQTTFDDLQRQLSTGKKAAFFKDLGSDILASKRARADLNKIDQFINNIQTAERRMNLMNSAIDAIRDQAENMSDTLNQEAAGGEVNLGVVNNLADSVFELVSDLLNEQDGQRHLFAGSDSLTQPYTDTGSMDTFLQLQINEWIDGNITNDQFIAQYTSRSNLNDTIMGYSASLSSDSTKAVSVRVDDSSEIDYTVLADNDAFRNILAVVSTVKNITATLDEVTLDEGDPNTLVTAPGADAEEQSSNFQAVFNDLATLMTSALEDLNTVQFSLNQAQVQMEQVRENHLRDQNVQQTIISEIEDADINEVALKFTAVQSQLEATFAVTATLRDLSLVNFL